MSRLKDLTGQVFGRYTVIRRHGSDSLGKATWLCLCSCGTEHVVRGYALTRGSAKSCGCLVKETSSQNSTKHGLLKENHPTYRTWASMKNRCANEKDPNFKNYGARGIVVCDRWRESFAAFFEDMGAKPAGMSLDRIDVNGNYEPKNCRWATVEQQQNNKRNNALITVKGVTKTHSQWARELGIHHSTIGFRVRSGWTPEDAATKPGRFQVVK